MSEDIRVAFLDVGVGDAIAITFTEGGVRRCILVDGGDTKKAAGIVSRHLADERIRAIDLLVATHFDQDHIRGLIYLLRDMADGKGPLGGLKVENYWGPMPLPGTAERLLVPEGLHRSSRFIIQSVQQNEDLLKEIQKCITDTDAIRFPSTSDPPPLDLFPTFRIELLAPEYQIPADEVQKAALSLPERGPLMHLEELRSIDDLQRAVRQMQAEASRRADHTANNLSIVLRLTPTVRGLRRWRILLTGDAEEESYTSIVDRGHTLSARILKVSHHGSANGTPPWVVSKIRPRYSIMSVGQRHGHPTEEVYRLLLRTGNEIFCTEKNLGRKPSGCKEFKCPKTDSPGPISIFLRRRRPRVKLVPDNVFCTGVLRQEFGN